ncbi:hypothetical protein CCONF_04090 [Corynebacterium confusum]|nr:hypothetical protein CCONF_04090 [Corynebacterium confusum]
MKKALMLGMAYFNCTVGAGFASGQEMLQYYADFGWWGVIGAIIALVLMPLAAMIAMQYGSYFQATSHDRVFSSVSGKFLARFWIIPSPSRSFAFPSSCWPARAPISTQDA